MERRMILLGGGVFAGIAIWTLYAFNPNIPGHFSRVPGKLANRYTLPGLWHVEVAPFPFTRKCL